MILVRGRQLDCISKHPFLSLSNYSTTRSIQATLHADSGGLGLIDLLKVLNYFPEVAPLRLVEVLFSSNNKKYHLSECISVTVGKHQEISVAQKSYPIPGQCQRQRKR